EADAAPFRVKAGEFGAVEADLAAELLAKPADGLEQHGLAGPGRAEHDEHPAGRDGQVHRLESERSGTGSQPADTQPAVVRGVSFGGADRHGQSCQVRASAVVRNTRGRFWSAGGRRRERERPGTWRA